MPEKGRGKKKRKNFLYAQYNYPSHKMVAFSLEIISGGGYSMNQVMLTILNHTAGQINFCPLPCESFVKITHQLEVKSHSYTKADR